MFEYTYEQLQEMKRQALYDLIEYAGTKAHLAKMLGVNSQIVHNWIQQGAISKNGVKLVQKNKTLSTKFPKERLRPEL